jgi:hypothetical protein
MQGKAVEWKVLRERPKITLAYAPGRDRMIDDQAEDEWNKLTLSRSSIDE